MLYAVMKECRNYFTKTASEGSFRITGGVLELTGTYYPGQYIRITGSTLNDGIYQVPEDRTAIIGLADETFTGAVCGLAVPADFVALVDEIREYAAEYGQENRTLISETIQGYSYTRATTAAGMPVSWREAFRTRLNGYRRMFGERSVCRTP